MIFPPQQARKRVSMVIRLFALVAIWTSFLVRTSKRALASTTSFGIGTSLPVSRLLRGLCGFQNKFYLHNKLIEKNMWIGQTGLKIKPKWRNKANRDCGAASWLQIPHPKKHKQKHMKKNKSLSAS